MTNVVAIRSAVTVVDFSSVRMVRIVRGGHKKTVIGFAFRHCQRNQSRSE